MGTRRRELSKKLKGKVGAARPAVLRSRWRRQLPRMVSELSSLYARMQVFQELLAVVRANPAVLQPPLLFNWARDNYGVAVCLGIRRLADASDGVVSLGHLLREVELRPEVVGKRSYRALTRKQGLTRVEADGQFERRAGRHGEQLRAADVARDIRRIDRAEHRIRKLVNKRLAHATPLTSIRRPPTFDEIELVLEELDQVLVKYDALIGGGGLTTVHAALLDWRRVLEKPWLDRTARRAVQRYDGPRHARLG